MDILSNEYLYYTIVILMIIYSSHFQFDVDEQYLKFLNKNITIYFIIIVILWEQEDINLRYSLIISTGFLITLYILRNYQILEKSRDLVSDQVKKLLASFYYKKQKNTNNQDSNKGSNQDSNKNSNKNNNNDSSPIDNMLNYNKYGSSNISAYISNNSHLLK